MRNTVHPSLYNPQLKQNKKGIVKKNTSDKQRLFYLKRKLLILRPAKKIGNPKDLNLAFKN